MEGGDERYYPLSGGDIGNNPHDDEESLNSLVR